MDAIKSGGQKRPLYTYFSLHCTGGQFSEYMRGYKNPAFAPYRSKHEFTRTDTMFPLI